MSWYKHAPGVCCLLCFVDLLPLNQAAHLAETLSGTHLLQLWQNALPSPQFNEKGRKNVPGHYQPVLLFEAWCVETSGVGVEAETKFWHK